MRISDWSSDVCSSDLTALQVTSNHRTIRHFMRLAWTVVVATTAAYQTAKSWNPDIFTPPPRFNQPSNGTNPSFAGITGRACPRYSVSAWGDPDYGGSVVPYDVTNPSEGDRKSVVEGKSVSVRVDHGGSRI